MPKKNIDTKCTTLLLSRKLLSVLERIPDRSEFIRSAIAYGLDQDVQVHRRKTNGAPENFRQTSFMIDNPLHKRLCEKAQKHLVSSFAEAALRQYLLLTLTGEALEEAKLLLEPAHV